ncbi:helix-turn-helix domain-containing protein [Micropruina sp.]|uniref:helix-turn-helix domain-containing protein n=1 Tax=Micropruina sp. TaxID=2737536 RepID=UPI0039E635BE
MTTEASHGRTYEFGMPDRLRVSRERAGFTVRQFEQVTGISRGSIGNYEAGRTTPRRPQLAQWALATGFDFEWLASGWAHWESNPEPAD